MLSLKPSVKQCKLAWRVPYRNQNFINPLSANPTKWSNTLKQFIANLLTNCLSVFDHFVELALKGLTLSVVANIKNQWSHYEFV